MTQMDFKDWLEAIGTAAWDDEHRARQSSALADQDRQVALGILQQVALNLNQGNIFGTARRLKEAAERLNRTLKSNELNQMPMRANPIQVLESLSDKLSQKESGFNNLTNKETVKKAVSQELYALQTVIAWLSKLPLWQVPLANLSQLP